MKQDAIWTALAVAMLALTTVHTGGAANLAAPPTLPVLKPAPASLEPAGSSPCHQEDPLPTPRHGISAVWTGEDVYVFGGRWNENGADTAEVLRYDPATGDAAVVGKLPSARAHTSAVWTGDVAYVFGGQERDGTRLDDIVRFDPESTKSAVLD